MDSEPVLPQTEPVILPSTPPVRKFSPLLILAIVILLVFVGVGGVLLGKSLNTSQPSAQPTVAPIPTQIPTPTLDPTANWKTYTNTKYGYSFKYSTAGLAEEQSSPTAGQDTVTISSPGLNFVLDIQQMRPELAQFYLGSSFKKEKLLNGRMWTFLTNPGYCDAGSCGQPFIVYQLIKDNFRYAFVFLGATAESEFQTFVVSSFKFD